MIPTRLVLVHVSALCAAAGCPALLAPPFAHPSIVFFEYYPSHSKTPTPPLHAHAEMLQIVLKPALPQFAFVVSEAYSDLATSAVVFALAAAFVLIADL